MVAGITKIGAFFLCQGASHNMLGNARLADTVLNVSGVPTLSDASEFRLSTLGSQDIQGEWVWRYRLEGTEDEFRRIQSVDRTLGVLTMEGAAWDDEADLNYIRIGFDPREVLRAMDMAYLRLQSARDVVLAAGGYDLDLETPGASYWSQFATNMAVGKVEAGPSDKVTGKLSLNLTATADTAVCFGPNVPGSLELGVRCVPGEELVCYVCIRAPLGAFTVQFYNASASQVFGQPFTYTGSEFCYIKLKENAPLNCNGWMVKFSCAHQGDFAWVDAVAGRSIVAPRLSVDSWLDERWSIPLISRQKFNGQLTNMVYPAPYRQNAGDLVAGTQYVVQVKTSDANPTVLEFANNARLGDDLFYLRCQQPRYYEEPWTTLSSLTSAPQLEVLAQCMVDITNLLVSKTKDPFWANENSRWREQTGIEGAPRVADDFQPRVEMVIND